MTQSSPDVTATIRRVEDVNANCKWSDAEHVDYDLVATILHHECGYSEEEAHEAIFEAVMAGDVVLEMTKAHRTDWKESLCISAEV